MGITGLLSLTPGWGKGYDTRATGRSGDDTRSAGPVRRAALLADTVPCTGEQGIQADRRPAPGVARHPPTQKCPHTGFLPPQPQPLLGDKNTRAAWTAVSAALALVSPPGMDRQMF